MIKTLLVSLLLKVKWLCKSKEFVSCVQIGFKRFMACRDHKLMENKERWKELFERLNGKEKLGLGL